MSTNVIIQLCSKHHKKISIELCVYTIYTCCHGWVKRLLKGHYTLTVSFSHFFQIYFLKKGYLDLGQNQPLLPSCRWGLEYAVLYSPSKNVCPRYDTSLNLKVRLQFWKSGSEESFLHCHYSQAHSGPSWLWKYTFYNLKNRSMLIYLLWYCNKKRRFLKSYLICLLQTFADRFAHSAFLDEKSLE